VSAGATLPWTALESVTASPSWTATELAAEDSSSIVRESVEVPRSLIAGAYVAAAQLLTAMVPAEELFSRTAAGHAEAASSPTVRACVVAGSLLTALELAEEPSLEIAAAYAEAN